MRERKEGWEGFVHITCVATQCPCWPNLGTLSCYCHHMPRCRLVSRAIRICACAHWRRAQVGGARKGKGGGGGKIRMV